MHSKVVIEFIGLIAFGCIAYAIASVLEFVDALIARRFPRRRRKATR